VVTIIAIREGEPVEVDFCCAPHARETCKNDQFVTWWEIFDARGNMIDSADQEIEENLECDKFKKNKKRRKQWGDSDSDGYASPG
jgi:hypothetical protein